MLVTTQPAATRDMYLDEKGNVIPLESTRTYKAAGIPRNCYRHLERFGTKKLSNVMAMSIELAEKGYILSDRQPDGTPYQARELFVQSDLAETLKRTSTEGFKGFL